MNRLGLMTATIVAWATLIFCGTTHTVVSAAQNWSIPPTADSEHSPLQPGEKVAAKGRAVFASNCASCHGASGRGDGGAGDRTHPPADLTDPSVAQTNSDGMLFYKIWNGRKAPNMPSFKSRLTRDDVWAVVEYVKTLSRTVTP